MPYRLLLTGVAILKSARQLGYKLAARERATDCAAVGRIESRASQRQAIAD